MPYLGELAAVLTSVLWAICSLAFASAGRRIGAAAVNQLRIYVAVVVLAIAHAVAFGSLWPEDLSSRQLTELAVSGVIGLALGDLCLFHCMAIIGPRLGSVLMAMAPAMTAVLAVWWIDELLGSVEVAGVVAVTVGVVVVIGDRRTRERWRPPAGASPRMLFPVALGLVAALGQAVSVLMSKSGMAVQVDGVESEIDPLAATLCRMTGAALGVLAIAVFGGQVASTVRAFRDRTALAWMGVGTLTGPILGVWLSMVAVASAKAGVAATLLSLAPVFMIPIAWFAYGSRIGVLGLVGTFVAVGGTALLFL